MPPKAKAAPAAAAPKPKAKPEAKPKAAPKAKKEEKKEDDTPKIPVVEKPDATEFDAKIGAVNAEIEKLQKKQTEITKKIGDRSTGKEEFFKQKAEIRSQLDEFTTKINGLQEQKDKIIKSVGEKRGEAQTQRTELNKLKKSIGFTSETEIDDRIASIEFRLWTDSISLKEEKQLLAEIQELKRNRPKVSLVNKKEGELANFDSGLSSKEQVAELNAQLGTLRDAKRKVSEQLTELQEKRNAQLGDVQEDITARDTINKQIQDQIKIRNELRDEKRASERKYNDYLAELRKIRAEKANEERKQRQEEYALLKRKKQAEALDEQPYVSEMTLIEQTILFCKNLTASKGPEKTEEVKEQKFDNPDGYEVLAKKEDRDEFYFAPASKGKKGKAKKAAGEGSKKPIKHNAETFRLFDQLKLNAPITTDDVPPLIVELEKQLESYKEKIKDWEEKREERKRRILEGLEDEEKEAAAAAAEEAKEEEKPAEAEAEEKEEEAEPAEAEEEKAEEEAPAAEAEEEEKADD